MQIENNAGQHAYTHTQHRHTHNTHTTHTVTHTHTTNAHTYTQHTHTRHTHNTLQGVVPTATIAVHIRLFVVPWCSQSNVAIDGPCFDQCKCQVILYRNAKEYRQKMRSGKNMIYIFQTRFSVSDCAKKCFKREAEKYLYQDTFWASEKVKTIEFSRIWG